MRRWLLVLTLVSSWGCGPPDRPSDMGDPGDPGDPGDACEDVVDVLFVLDVSSSMTFLLDGLNAGIADVVAAANGLAPDAHFGLIPFVDNHAFDTTGSLEGGRVHTDAATLQAAFGYSRDTYTTPNRNPGDGPGGATTQNPICEENALDALYAAATEFPWRENATRVIIVATDDTFLETPDNYGDRDHDGDTTSTDYPREGNYPARRGVLETTDSLRAARTRVFSFSRLVEPSLFDLGRCGTDRRLPWPSIAAGWSQPYLGHDPIPVLTDGENFDIDQVKNGTLSLAETINSVVLDSHCNPPLL